ncbi:MAG: DUF4388 domain-containing protein [Thermoanaerobaculia bacterium]|jgi:hypothetical protein|nr:DUF4388 domain-containing protein [Thermoanaerobaculia bacterium]MBP9824224.1 DUF4388 domain-containing protein [Thermoanaerobaculia bacterium]
MEFTGRLSAFPASNLLQWALTERVTGTLVVRRSQREKRIGFRVGKILDCRSNQATEHYGQHLVAHGILGAEDLAKALAHCRLRRLPLGETLSDLGLLDEASLRASLAQSIQESVQDLFFWRQGLFYFQEGTPPASRLEVEVETTELLLAGTHWIDDQARIRGVLTSDSVVVRPGLNRTSEDLLLSPYELRIVRSAAPEASLSDLYLRTGGVHFPFLSACYGLVTRGALEIVRNAEENAVASREIDLRELLLSLQAEDEVVVGAASAIFPLEVIESLVPAWIRKPLSKELEAMPIRERAFLDGFDGRTTLRRLLSPAVEDRADQIELLLVELRKRNVVLLPASLEDVDRRLDGDSPIRRLVRKLKS